MASHPKDGWVDPGGLMSSQASVLRISRRTANVMYCKGAKPADLPVQQPMTFELVINVKTTQRLGLTIPHRCCSKRMRSSDKSAERADNHPPPHPYDHTRPGPNATRTEDTVASVAL
jgi:ABC-type uncharacterized transport system substrate-binding protein